MVKERTAWTLVRGQRKRDRSDPARWEEAAHGGGGGVKEPATFPGAG